MSYGNWKPYVSVAKRRAQAAKAAAKANKAGQSMAPVVIEGRAIEYEGDLRAALSAAGIREFKGSVS